VNFLEKCFSCEEIAERYNVKLLTVWDWIRKKKLPAIKTGKQYSIRPEDVKRFEQERKTI
jgi:excisionase family DNA binding protein